MNKLTACFRASHSCMPAGIRIPASPAPPLHAHTCLPPDVLSGYPASLLIRLSRLESLFTYIQSEGACRLLKEEFTIQTFPLSSTKYHFMTLAREFYSINACIASFIKGFCLKKSKNKTARKGSLKEQLICRKKPFANMIFAQKKETGAVLKAPASFKRSLIL